MILHQVEHLHHLRVVQMGMTGVGDETVAGDGQAFETTVDENLCLKWQIGLEEVDHAADDKAVGIGLTHLLQVVILITVYQLLNDDGRRHLSVVHVGEENLCCVLEYNSIVHPELSADTLYINPYDHQASLYGGWWNAVPNNTSANGRIWTTRDNLTALRETAAKVLGFASASDACPTDDVPKPFADFLRSAPLSNAYEDFGYWDDVLIKSYGERKFINMETDDQQIYGKGK